jgi:hypothetical protein
LESALLDSCYTSEPPESAEDELWHRLKALPHIGAAAAAAGLATKTAAAATSKATIKPLWGALLKWGALVAVAGPAVGATAHVVVSHRHSEPSLMQEHSAPGAHGAATAGADVPTGAGPRPDALSEPVSPEPSATDAPGRVPTGMPAARVSRPRDGTASESLSMLEAESRLVEAARGRLAAGDARGALDDIAHVAVQFPHGRLKQEQELVAIDSLAALGERAAMQSRARAFLERFPRGAYAQHVRRLLER